MPTRYLRGSPTDGGRVAAGPPVITYQLGNLPVHPPCAAEEIRYSADLVHSRGVR